MIVIYLMDERLLTTAYSVNRWLSTRFNLLSAIVIGVVGLISVMTFMDASLAGFALTFASTITNDVRLALSFCIFADSNMS